MGGMTTFDMRDLANALVNNGQNSLPPQGVERLGVVAGYDPHWINSDSTTYPAVSVFLAGDDLPTHGCRFDHAYHPHTGDSVICKVTGPECYVLGMMSGNTRVVVKNGTPVVQVVHNSTTVETHQQYVIGSNQSGGEVNIAGKVGGYTIIAGSKTPATFYPNILYTVELTADFSLIRALADTGNDAHYAYTFGILTPTGWKKIAAGNTHGGTVNDSTITVSGTIKFSDDVKNLKKGQWLQKYPNNQFDWQVGAQTDTDLVTGGTTNPPTIRFSGSATNLTLTISANGPAS